MNVNEDDWDGDGVPDTFDNCRYIPNPNQRDTNNDGLGNICDPDLDNDGDFDNNDLNLIIAADGTSGPDEDLNDDGTVNFDDYEHAQRCIWARKRRTSRYGSKY